MSNIVQNLQKILSSIYGKDVRQAIHDSIEDCYNDGRSGATDLTARQMLAQISPSVNALIASNRALDTLELTVTDPIDSNFELYTDGVPLKLFITGNVVSLDGVLKTSGTIGSSSTEQLMFNLSATLGTQFGDDAPKYYPKRKTRYVSNGSGSAKFMLVVDTSSGVYFSRYNDYKDTSLDYVASVPSGTFIPIHAMWICEGVPIDNAVGVVTDKTLSIEDMPADAKAVGDALGSASGGGLSNEAKQALLNCFDHVAWKDEHGQDYYDALEDALYPPADLLSITALYTQSGTVYDTDTLDSLKPDLIVTAQWDNNTTSTVTTYTLSGTLTTGTSTITVSYGGKTATFNVTVTEAPVVPLYQITSFQDKTSGSYITMSIEDYAKVTYTTTSNSRNCYVKPNGDIVQTVPSSTWFTLSQGDEYVLKVKNIAYTGSTSGSNKIRISFANANDVGVINSGDIAFGSGAGTVQDVEITGTISDNETITSMYITQYRASETHIDVELWVNGSRYV